MIVLWMVLLTLGTPPGWGDQITIRPPRLKPMQFGRGEPPSTLLYVPRRQKAALSFAGPGRLTLHLHGVVRPRRRAKRWSRPGAVFVRVGRGRRQLVRLERERTQWQLRKRPAWAVTKGKTVTLKVPAGRRVRLRPHRRTRLGYAFYAEWQPQGDAAPQSKSQPTATETADAPPPPPPAPPSRPSDADAANTAAAAATTSAEQQSVGQRQADSKPTADAAAASAANTSGTTGSEADATTHRPDASGQQGQQPENAGAADSAAGAPVDSAAGAPVDSEAGAADSAPGAAADSAPGAAADSAAGAPVDSAAGAAAQPAAGEDAAMPTLMAAPGEPAPSADKPQPSTASEDGEDIPLVSSPMEAPTHAQKGVTVREPASARLDLQGPNGTETFYHAKVDAGLTMDVGGPGTLVVDIHAHRDKSRPETLEPLVVAVLVDDVLVQTLSIEQPPAARYSLPSLSGVVPSKRASLRLPIDVGQHKVQLSLSDTAARGASLRPRFEEVGATPNAVLVTSEGRSQLPMPEPVAGSAALAVFGGAWLPAQLAPGAAVQLEGDLGVPVVGSRLSVGLFAGYRRANAQLAAPSPRTPGQLASTELTVQTLPVGLDMRIAAPMPDPWVLQFGLGGGATLLWTRTRTNDAQLETGADIAPTGYGHISMGIALGDGALLLRGQLAASAPIDNQSLASFSINGATLGIGYQLGGSG